jgi:hypothetical protein
VVDLKRSWHHDAWTLAACAVLAWLGLRGQRVPLLSSADLGFHELGHLVSYFLAAVIPPWPEAWTAAAGSAFQVGVPLGVGLYFLINRRDPRGAAICFTWAATAAHDVARYIADAPFEALPLIGGEHDWAAILGPDHLDRLDDAASWAATVQNLGWALFVAGVTTVVVRYLGTSKHEDDHDDVRRSVPPRPVSPDLPGRRV